MLGRHHLALTVLTSAVLVYPFFPGDTWFIAMLGAAIGSLIPDSDSPDAMIFHNRVRSMGGQADDLLNRYFAPLFPLFGYTTKYLIYLPMIYFYRFLGLKVEKKHRGLMHSILGIFTSAVLTFLLIIPVLWLLELDLIMAMYFTVFYLFGAFMHIFEDSMTVSGINWVYPFSSFILKGDIRTSTDSSDNKILNILVTILTLVVSSLYIADTFLFLSVSGLILIWSALVFHSRIRLER